MPHTRHFPDGWMCVCRATSFVTRDGWLFRAIYRDEHSENMQLSTHGYLRVLSHSWCFNTAGKINVIRRSSKMHRSRTDDTQQTCCT